MFKIRGRYLLPPLLLTEHNDEEREEDAGTKSNFYFIEWFFYLFCWPFIAILGSSSLTLSISLRLLYLIFSPDY
jgi:hypothetical protein